MTVEYLLVTFPQQRNVLADGTAVGVTNQVLMLPGDEYQISLDGGGCAPESQDIELTGTSQAQPLKVVFNLAAAAPTTRGRIATLESMSLSAPPPAPVPAAKKTAAKKSTVGKAAPKKAAAKKVAAKKAASKKPAPKKAVAKKAVAKKTTTPARKKHV
ncbi:MAG: hypothetical protein JSR59_04495 [Proteobacteria bacterium]|nr:hypothetical protein [Pseudomonadota bacterium]